MSFDDEDAVDEDELDEGEPEEDEPEEDEPPPNGLPLSLTTPHENVGMMASNNASLTRPQHAAPPH